MKTLLNDLHTQPDDVMQFMRQVGREQLADESDWRRRCFDASFWFLMAHPACLLYHGVSRCIGPHAWCEYEDRVFDLTLPMFGTDGEQDSEAFWRGLEIEENPFVYDWCAVCQLAFTQKTHGPWDNELRELVILGC